MVEREGRAVVREASLVLPERRTSSRGEFWCLNNEKCVYE